MNTLKNNQVVSKPPYAASMGNLVVVSDKELSETFSRIPLENKQA